MVAIDLSPMRALRLAEKLLEAARDRLPEPSSDGQTVVPTDETARNYFCPVGIPPCEAQGNGRIHAF